MEGFKKKSCWTQKPLGSPWRGKIGSVCSKMHLFPQALQGNALSPKCSALLCTLNSSESIWPPPFSTGVYQNEEPAPEGQRDKEISLSQFISSLFDGVGQLLPGDLAGLLMRRPGSSQLGTPVAKRCRRGFPEVYRVYSVSNLKSLKRVKTLWSVKYKYMEIIVYSWIFFQLIKVNILYVGTAD